MVILLPGLFASSVPATVAGVRDRWAQCLPWVFLALIAVSRWPGLLPPNFSAVYALMFCAGAYFPRRQGLVGPIAVLLATDLALNTYYAQVKGWPVWSARSFVALSFNYLGYVALFFAGRGTRPLAEYCRRALGSLGGLARWLMLTLGGFASALLFYLITNTASWLFNPFQNSEYTRDLAGWLIALTLGTKNLPQTWEFFRNTFFSSGLFAALFAGAWELTASESPADKGVPNRDEEERSGEGEASESPA